MNLSISILNCYCETSIFCINGVKADINDFGEKYDRDEENAEDSGCGDMQFTRVPSTPEVLAKYNITEQEYSQVCDELEEKLSWGYCNWCN